MIDRRQFIHRIRDSLLVVSAALVGCTRALTKSSADDPQRLIDTIESLRARDYSETGVSMILACENLADNSPLPTDTDGGHAYEAFTRYADMFLEQRPDASEDDVAAIIELVAHKDFWAGGQEFPL